MISEQRDLENAKRLLEKYRGARIKICSKLDDANANSRSYQRVDLVVDDSPEEKVVRLVDSM